MVRHAPEPGSQHLSVTAAKSSRPQVRRMREEKDGE